MLLHWANVRLHQSRSNAKYSMQQPYCGDVLRITDNTFLIRDAALDKVASI